MSAPGASSGSLATRPSRLSSLGSPVTPTSRLGFPGLTRHTAIEARLPGARPSHRHRGSAPRGSPITPPSRLSLQGSPVTPPSRLSLQGSPVTPPSRLSFQGSPVTPPSRLGSPGLPRHTAIEARLPRAPPSHRHRGSAPPGSPVTPPSRLGSPGLARHTAVEAQLPGLALLTRQHRDSGGAAEMAERNFRSLSLTGRPTHASSTQSAPALPWGPQNCACDEVSHGDGGGTMPTPSSVSAGRRLGRHQEERWRMRDFRPPARRCAGPNRSQSPQPHSLHHCSRGWRAHSYRDRKQVTHTLQDISMQKELGLIGLNEGIRQVPGKESHSEAS
ncbi:hypothetical protein NN561_018879 [Cricetulus griseus]